MTIQPTAVYPPARDNAPVIRTGRQRATYDANIPPVGGDSGRGGWAYNVWYQIPNGNGNANNAPSGVPQMLGNRSVLMVLWFMTMLMVAMDEHFTYKLVLPRPSRLWSTSFFYLILAVIGTADALVPLVNLFAIGITLALAYKMFTAQSDQTDNPFGPATGTGVANL